MATKKISELPAGTAALTDIIPAMNAGGTTTSKLTVSAILDLLVDSAPSALDTLHELATSLNDDADFAGTMTTALAGKASTTSPASIITSGTFPASRIDTGTTSATVCVGDDARLSDSRTPLAHATSLVTSGTFDVARLPTGTDAASVCIGNDARLSDARTPVAHAASLVTSGTLDVARIPTGTDAASVCIGNDSRLSDARTPVAHAASLVTSGTFDIARIPTITQAKLPATAVVSDTSTEANSSAIANVVSISQTNYNALVSASATNATTLYVIT